ncbi:CHAT domain-containing protein [Mycena venus]|uniref:CHAT domain-containing protein n=1 Tax=Mycena venus TaxID=2733690 RepID=A0A8H7CPV7_9AGAR|nr:CHAT domain-containing protein [Mycena venus]
MPTEPSLTYNTPELALHAPHPAHGESLSNLANTIKTRFGQQGDSKDIDETIELHREALALYPPPHPNRSSILNNLAAALQARFEQQENSKDLDEAIELHEEALTLHAPPHSERGPSLMALGVCLVTKYKHRHHSLDLDSACAIFKEAATYLSSSPIIRFRHANYWAFIAAQYRHTSSLAAYHAAIELLPQLAALHLDLSSRQQILSAASGTTLASDAAACAMSLGNYDIAVEFLEAVRSVFWSQALRLRTSLDGLAIIQPDLAHRLKELSRRLEQASFRDTRKDTLADAQQKIMSIESEGARCRQLNENWEQAIQSVRMLPGFEHFMKPKDIAALQQAAISGPIIILTTTDSTCSALIVTITYVQCLKLPEMTLPKVELLAKGFKGAFNFGNATRIFGQKEESGNMDRGDVFQGLLADLWKEIVKPVFAALGLQKSVDPPRLWWCPTGPFAFLPLHAAGIYDTATSECTSDYVVSSYTLTLTALLDPPAHIAVPFKVTAVIQPNAPNGVPLPGTMAELNKIMTRVPTQWLTTLLDSTVETALVHLPESSIVHFACHGTQNLQQPLDSALVLTDGHLRISDIMHRLERDKRFGSLAFLSASETARGDDTIPDEGMHLAATFLFAGFRGVVATMWTMDDRDGSQIADTFYEHLFKNSDPNSDPPVLPDLTGAAKALHHAVAKLREEPDIHFKRWIPFVHYGL